MHAWQRLQGFPANSSMNAQRAAVGEDGGACCLDQPWTTPPASAASTPRAAAIGRLAADLAALATVGDVHGAHVLHEALGRLLAAEGVARTTVPIVPTRLSWCAV